MHFHPQQSRLGFSLLEILTVMAIISCIVLFGINHFATDHRQLFNQDLDSTHQFLKTAKLLANAHQKPVIVAQSMQPNAHGTTSLVAVMDQNNNGTIDDNDPILDHVALQSPQLMISIKTLQAKNQLTISHLIKHQHQSGHIKLQSHQQQSTIRISRHGRINGPSSAQSSSK